MTQSATYTITTSDANESWAVVSNGSTDYTVQLGNTVVLASASVGAVTIHLPTAAGDNQDRVLIIKKTDSTTNKVWVNPNGSETIDGNSSNYELTAQYQSVTLVSDGSNWNIV